MITLLNKLPKDEIQKFERFVNSPYFNTVENVKKLFNYLKPLYPNISKTDITSAKISENVYDKQSPTSEIIWKLKSDFSKLLEKFLLQKELEKNSMGNEVTLIQSLRHIGANKEIELLLHKHRKEKNKIFNKESSYYLNKVNLHEEEYFFKMPDIQFEFPDDLQYKSDNLDYFYIFSKLHTFYDMSIHQYHNKNILKFNKTFYPELTEYVKINEKNISKDHPNIYIIFLVLMMSRDKDQDSYYFKLVKYLKLKDKIFSKIQLCYYYRYLVSYCHIKLNEGFEKYRDEVYEIYKLMFEKDLFILDNVITDREFNNVVNVSLPLLKIQWTELFIEKNKDYLPQDLSIESYNLAKAKLFFYNKEFDKVFPHLNLIHYKDPNYYINAKILLIKVLFETNSIDVLFSTIDSLRKYISREKKLPELLKVGVKNFIKFVTALSKIKKANKKEEIRIIKQSIENENNFISSKSWIIEKVNEIENA